MAVLVRIKFLILASLIVIAMTAANTQAATYTLFPDDDAHVKQWAPGNNYGRLNYLYTGGGASSSHAYLSFYLGGIGEEETITGATLNLFHFYGSTAWINLYHISDDNWDESSITWNNRPDGGSMGSWLGGEYILFPWDWVSFDLSETGAWDPLADQTDSFVTLLVSPFLEDVFFFSKEHYSGWKSPYLTITTTTTTAPVPIPSTLWFLASGLLGYPFIRRTRGDVRAESA